ncbi:hypothetical protein GPECTOR_15g506 [Gonium pectorale]|uniref:BACK domain-containing protein n=1 Tax=Gonium pectorale TaxID=33097 RepID=A0A150GN96_GONPE|nr:hypothetical protein GPECTOR_15g506 [Gonium pectorale]|eukprot:KXZ50820.1 hypothetical protein GPECTOR_15g506 [Gonium pectorale]
MPPFNPRVAAALAESFGNVDRADCSIVFVREKGHAAAAGSKRSRSDGEAGEPLAEALPALTHVLELASDWFKTALQKIWRRAGENASGAQPQQLSSASAATSGGGDGAAGSSPGLATGLPVLLVPLGCAEEVPSARAAIKFAYTGQVERDSSVRELLQLYRQGGYLQVEGCAEACLDAIRDKLAGPSTAGAGGSSSSGGGSGGGSGGSSGGGGGPDSRLCPEVLELYDCIRLWPDPSVAPAFAAITSLARARLVSHFCDALTTLNTPELRRQLLALPAEALKVLLEADDFGTDVEDTILLMLATWVQENGSSTNAETVERLCRLVRLAQLSPDFAGAVLPLLACARISGLKQSGSGGLGWFPITVTEAAFFVSCCAAAASSVPKRQRLLEQAKGKLNLPAACCSTKPHRQCLSAPSGGDVAAASGSSGPQQPQPQSLTFEWSVSQEELQRGLRELEPGGVMRLECTLDHGLSGISARGYEWSVIIQYRDGGEAAGLFLRCQLPAAYGLDRQALGGRLVALAQVGARLEVDHWRNGVREVVHAHTYGASDFIGVGSGWGADSALPLKRGGEGVAADGGGGGGSLGAWSEYLHGGKLMGRLVLLPL